MRRSHRHEVVVVGAGLAGICAAVTAAREGALVALIEAREQLGGRVGPDTRGPLLGADRCNFAYARETGLIDEILIERLRRDSIGSYETWGLVLRDLVRGEPRVDLFEGVTITEASNNQAGDRIESIMGHGMLGRSIEKFRGLIFIDCTGEANLACLAGTEILPMKEPSGEQNVAVWREGIRLITYLRARKTDGDAPFLRPDWVRIDWEQNEVAPRVSFAESFLAHPEEVVAVEWAGEIPENPPPDAREIAYAAWDFVKNHSRFRERSQKYDLAWISTRLLSKPTQRVAGGHVLRRKEIERQMSFPDAITTGGAGFAGIDTFATSPLGHVEQPGPFVVPLSSLHSKDLKNLFVAGGHASASANVSFSLEAPLTSASLGEAVGAAARAAVLSQKEPSALTTESESTALRVALMRRNHDVWQANTVDPSDRAPHAEISVSSTLPSCCCEKPDRPIPTSVDDLICQFPVSTEIIESVSLLLDIEEDTELHATLLNGPDNHSTYPSESLAETTIAVKPGRSQWVEFPLQATLLQPGWFFLRLGANEQVTSYLCENAPVGVLRQVTRKSGIGPRNPYTDLQPVLPVVPGPASGSCFRIEPQQAVYEASNLLLPETRPSGAPNLWISQATDFQYPEWIELGWTDEVTIGRVDIVFDGSLEYRFPERPKPSPWRAISSIVRSYRLLVQNEEGKWDELVSVTDNHQGFRTHRFDPIQTKVLELEILGTHGLNRAQIYAIRVYGS
ncbi:MAG: FAD-dependent oxidoreductase [Opitutales bacterium]